jgi:hypothetical protein
MIGLFTKKHKHDHQPIHRFRISGFQHNVHAEPQSSLPDLHVVRRFRPADHPASSDLFTRLPSLQTNNFSSPAGSLFLILYIFHASPI